MSSPDTVPARPDQAFHDWIVTSRVLVALVWLLAVIGVLVDWLGHDLPNPLLTLGAVLAGTLTVLCGAAQLVYGANERHAHNFDLVLLRLDNLKGDTGEIHRIREGIHQPEIIVVERAVHRVESVDRETAMRVLHKAEEKQQKPVPADVKSDGDRELYWQTYTDALTDLAGLGSGDEGAAEPA